MLSTVLTSPHGLKSGLWQVLTGKCVSATGLILRPQGQFAKSLGVYEKRLPMFASIEPDGVCWGDGRRERVDVILWATGFRSAIKHLAPLHLTSAEGGIALECVAGNVQVAIVAAKNPRINLVGYEPLASSVGARHAGRQAPRSVRQWLQRNS